VTGGGTAEGAVTTSLVVGVVGAGTMGAGIAQVCLQAGHEVLLYDVDEAAIERGRGRISDGLDRLVVKGRLADSEATAMIERLRDAHALTALAEEADVVIEAALEDLDLKRTIFTALDSAARPDVLLATNTSALSVGSIAEAATRPERVLGLHFFNPAAVMPLVEVVAGELTAPDAVDRAIAFVEGLGKTAVPCLDAPGFIVNRINRPFTLEALRMLEAGEASVAEIDTAVEAAGYPMGPFRLMDLIGIDVNFAVARSIFAAFDEAERFRPSPIQAELVEAGQLGRKSGAGFYRYAGGQPGDVAYQPAPAATPPIHLSHAEIVQRIEAAVINEAYHAVGDQVAQPPDIDRAMKLGANHPYGPFERAGQLGLRQVVETLARLERSHGARFRVAPALWQVASL
jgi:3-hydroxybutyryl-CoA dehydrogenase